MEKVSEMKTEPIVGKFYLVECVKLERDGWVPVIGVPHNDPELGAYWQHQHKDVRFANASVMYEDCIEKELVRAPAMEYVIERGLRKMLCKRTMPEYPHEYLAENVTTYQRVYKPFHKAFAGRKVLCGKCPHKGMPLESLPKDKNGMVICNGHGLKIDMNKGEVVSRE